MRGIKMAEDDIYGNKSRYERWLTKFEKITEKPTRGKYYCKNPANQKYFSKLINHFEAKDLSYVRRVRVLHFLNLTTYVLEKDLAECDRDDINQLIAFTHKGYTTACIKGDAAKEIKITWK